MREMSQPVYLICGVPGSGKTWVCEQLKDKFHYIPHDTCWEHPMKKGSGDTHWIKGATSTHEKRIIKASKESLTPIITECPFGERHLREELQRHHISVIPYFVVEHPDTVKKRYEMREKKEIPKMFVTRSSSIVKRAREWFAPMGTSEEILSMLKAI